MGIVLLEMITGMPVWLPMKCKKKEGSRVFSQGLMGVIGRNPHKIIERQKAILNENLEETLTELDEIGVSQDPQVMDLLSQILQMDHEK